MEIILSFVQDLSWADVLDVLLVALCIYQFLRILQGTRSVQMLSGSIVLVGVYVGARHYDLSTVTWVLRHFFQDFFLVMVILFQDQIRQTLVSVGLTPFRGGGGVKRTGASAQIDEVVQACWALSREKTGALIVFEVKHGLLNYISSGTPLQAVLGADLIYSIFQHASPLHDGAVVISRGRIEAAGCFLPLSKNIDIHRHMGTRHRAAMGVSEVTDAVVITVSEETGKMHIFHRGELRLMDDPVALTDGLARLMVGEGPSILAQGAVK